MHYNLMILASAIVLASASFTAFAEETGTADEAAAKSQEATTAPADTATSGEAGKQTKLSRPVEKFGDWFKECEMVTSEKGEQIEICQISQTLIDEESNTAMMKMAVGYVPDKDQPVAVITLPLGIFLPPGIELQIDGKGKVGRLPINTCMPSGCQAGVQLDEDFVTRMKKGNQMTVTFGNPQGQGIAAPVSLSGFTAGLESLETEKPGTKKE
ncbi:MAG: invasion associated locus B family protein [Gammaproteobacteria bacterium]|jgi:invasion protein IalB